MASAEAYRIPVVLVFNKTDLLNEDEMRYQQMVMNLYETVGYHCLAISAETGAGVDDVRALLKGRISLLSGNSGVANPLLLISYCPRPT